jgi:3-hydroxybutyryl-CoA dehydrogenase
VSQPILTERLGIAGSGTIACGLARLAVAAGGAEMAGGPHAEAAHAGAADVVLWARSDRSAERAAARVGRPVSVVTELDALGDRSVVLEAVVEDEEIKAGLLSRLGRLVPAETLLGTTTSSLSIGALAKASARPDRFAGLHFFNPVDQMRLVELAFPDEASDSTRRRARGLCETLGKTSVEVPDSPGFVVNRLLFPYLFEAVRLIERDELAPAAVDTCMRLGASHPMGPLTLLDFVGLDVAVAIGESIGADVPDRLHRLIAEGKLGRKSGAGFYEY